MSGNLQSPGGSPDKDPGKDHRPYRINDQMVEGQPFVEEAVKGLLEFCEELPLLGII